MSKSAKTIAGRATAGGGFFVTGRIEVQELVAKPGTFMKGTDSRRNTRGRPPRRSLTAHLEDAITDDARKKIMMRVREAAKHGDMKAIEFIFDRLEGKPRQAVEHSGPDGTAIVLRWENDADA